MLYLFLKKDYFYSLCCVFKKYQVSYSELHFVLMNTVGLFAQQIHLPKTHNQL